CSMGVIDAPAWVSGARLGLPQPAESAARTAIGAASASLVIESSCGGGAGDVASGVPLPFIDTLCTAGLALVNPKEEEKMTKSKGFIGLLSALVCTGALAQAPAPRTLKMQSSWPASNTLQEHFKLFAERMEKLTQGSLKIDAMPAGQIVPPFE